MPKQYPTTRLLFCPCSPTSRKEYGYQPSVSWVMYATQRYNRSIRIRNGIAMNGCGAVAGRIISSRA